MIGELEKSKTDGGRLPDHNYILKTESDLMMDALQRQLMVEFESQKKAQADSFVAELAVNMRHFDGEWENDLKAPLKHGQRRSPNCYQDWTLPKLRKNVLQVEYYSSRRSFRTGQMK